MPISIWSSIWFYFYYSSFLFFPFLVLFSGFVYASGGISLAHLIFHRVEAVALYGVSNGVTGIQTFGALRQRGWFTSSLQLLACSRFFWWRWHDLFFFPCFWFFTLASLSLDVLVWMVSLDICSSGVVARKKHYSNRIALTVIQPPFICRMSELEVAKGDSLYNFWCLLLELRESSRFELGG